jgi:hypothetical protein
MNPDPKTCTQASVDTGYKVFIARYRWSGSWGAYREIDAVCVAESESMAHTWAVMEYKDTVPDCWSFEELSTESAGCEHISDRSS